MANVGKLVEGHKELKKKAKKVGLRISEGKFGKVVSFHKKGKKGGSILK